MVVDEIAVLVVAGKGHPRGTLKGPFPFRGAVVIVIIIDEFVELGSRRLITDIAVALHEPVVGRIAIGQREQLPGKIIGIAFVGHFGVRGVGALDEVVQVLDVPAGVHAVLPVDHGLAAE